MKYQSGRKTMKSEYQAHNDMRVDSKTLLQEENRAKNLAMIREEQRQSAANIARLNGFIKAAFFVVVGLFIALLLKEYGVWS